MQVTSQNESADLESSFYAPRHGLLNSNTWTGNAAKTASASDQDEACISRRDCCLGSLEKESFE